MKDKHIRKFMALIAAGASLCGVASAELTHHWEFNEGEGTTTEDIAGDNDGSIVGATWGTDATRDSYLIFNGTDNYVDPALILPALDLEVDFTWAVWVNAQASSTVGSQQNSIVIGNRKDGSNVDFNPREFLKLTPRRFEWHFNRATTTVDNTDLPEGTWIHVAVVKDGDNIQTYYNGTPNTSGTLPGALSSLMPFFIGGEPNAAGGEHFNGFIDDVRIYDNALTQAEVQAILTDAVLLPLWTVNPIRLDRIDAGTQLTGTINGLANDPREGTLTYAKVSGPEWLTIAPDGTLGGTPAAQDHGRNTFVVSAANSDGATETSMEILVIDLGIINPPLIAGWDSWTDLGEDTFDPTFTSMATAQVVGTLTGTGTIGNFGDALLDFGASRDGTWGSSLPGTDIPGPDQNAASALAGVGILNGSLGYFDFTVTADPGTTINFTSFNFDAYRRTGTSAQNWTLSVVSGAITNGPVAGATGTIAQGANAMSTADPNDWDVDLTVLPDRLLEGGETAVFRLEFTNGTGGGNTLIDNVGIFGEFGTDADTSLSVSLVGGNLVFTWNSEEGHLYNLRSDTGLVGPTSGWPVVSGQMDIMATPPVNTVAIPLPAADLKRFYVLEDYVPLPPLAFSDDFENGVGGWIASSTGNTETNWELGTPANVGPSAANSGSNCFGTNISADYSALADVSLRSPVIDLTEATGGTLKFAYFVAGEEFFDIATVNLLDSSDNLIEQIANFDGVTTADWTDFMMDLPAAALGQMVKLEFKFISDSGDNAPGFYIDDVEVDAP